LLYSGPALHARTLHLLWHAAHRPYSTCFTAKSQSPHFKESPGPRKVRLCSLNPLPPSRIHRLQRSREQHKAHPPLSIHRGLGVSRLPHRDRTPARDRHPWLYPFAQRLRSLRAVPHSYPFPQSALRVQTTSILVRKQPALQYNVAQFDYVHLPMVERARLVWGV
jgi:hypothetical protein